MSKNPLVSVIMPFFNAEEFIQESIESVFAQTFTEWELLLVDDGSTDKSTMIALKYSELNPSKVRYLEHERRKNRGLAATRNLGIKNAKGNYIAFLDADDVWVADKLYQQVEILELVDEAGMVCGVSKFWHSWQSNNHKSDYYSKICIKTNSLVYPPSLLIFTLEGKLTSPSMSNVIIKRNLLEDVGGFEDNLIGSFEDLIFLAKIFIKSPIYISNSCWDYYRQHPNSIMAKLKKTYKQKISKDVFYLEWLEDYLATKGLQNPELLQALKYSKIRLNHQMTYKHFLSFQKIMIRIKGIIMLLIYATVPKDIRSHIMSKLIGSNYYPRIGYIGFGDLKRLKPISECGFRDIDLTIDKYYIEKFLATNSHFVNGSVLELSNNHYLGINNSNHVTSYSTLRFKEISVLLNNKNLSTDIITPTNLQPDTYNCIISTQTLEYIYDVHSAIKILYLILKPGGVILATMTGISRTTDTPRDKYRYWNFTSLSVMELFKEVFPAHLIEVKAYGNVLTAISFLHGISSNELEPRELDYHDSNYEIIITIKAVKPK